MPTLESPVDLRQMSATVRRSILDRSYEAGVGHIGSALSVVEMLVAVWGRFLRQPGTRDVDRDRFVLCKGHAALALYAVMRECGLIDDAELRTYCQDGSRLGSHPEFGLPGVEIGTGSLGQGLSVACGLALALGRRKSPARVVALLSDAECNEGQVWEAAQFAAHRRLGNLIALVDANGMQAMGPTQDILDLDLAAKWTAFGWRVETIDGHDAPQLADRLDAIRTGDGRPTMLVAETQLGKGVSFMENRHDWHYRNLSAELYDRALEESR